MFKKENYKNFYFDLLNIDFNFFKIHISAIELNNNYISTHLGIQNDKNYFYLMPSFNSDSFQKFSTGNILLEKLVNYSKLNKLEVFDFTIGGENYKKKWINNSIDLYDLILPVTLLGKIIEYFIKIIFYFKKSFIDSIYRKIYGLFN